MRAASSSRIFLTFATLTLIWGTTWAAIRIGLEGIPPFTGVALRFGIAGIVLLVLALRARVPLGRKPMERSLWVINGLCSFCLSYGIVYWAEQWVPSGLAAVLFATFPLFVALLGHFVLPGERLDSLGVLGTLVAFGGVAWIFSEDFDLLGGAQVFLASLVMLISPFVSAVASVAIKRWGSEIHPLSITAVPMLLASGIMGVVALLVEWGDPKTFDVRSVGALLYLAIFGSAVTFSGFFWLLARVTANRVALMAYAIPVVAVLVGAVYLDEPITLRTLAGSAGVVLGVALAASRRSRGTPAAG